jgi:hypothetical protein
MRATFGGFAAMRKPLESGGMSRARATHRTTFAPFSDKFLTESNVNEKSQ